MSLPALRDALAEHGGTVARVLLDDPAGPLEDGPHPPQLVARGPRAAGRPAEYELLMEMILEGSLLHYGVPRVIGVDDPDLALLLGDQLYALGLSRLTDIGDLDAVAELADLISLLAQAQAAADAPLADAIWEAGAAAVGWGQSPEHETAKAMARAGDPGAPKALRAAAWRARARGEGRRGK